MTAYLQEVLGLSGSLLVKAFARERDEQQRFRALNDELRAREIHASLIARRCGSTPGSPRASASVRNPPAVARFSPQGAIVWEDPGIPP